VQALDRAYSYDAEYKARSHSVHKLTAALFGIEEVLLGRPMGAQLSARLHALKAAAPDDAVVAAALSALPPAVLQAERVPTCRELQRRFDLVVSQGRIASYVPEGSGLFGQLVGAAIAFLSFRETGLVQPVDAAAVLARAEYYVQREQLLPVSAGLGQGRREESVRERAVEDPRAVTRKGPLSRLPRLVLRHSACLPTARSTSSSVDPPPAHGLSPPLPGAPCAPAPCAPATPCVCAPAPCLPRCAQAVEELQALRGLPRTVAQDWMDTAMQRVTLEQALTLLRAHTITLACALA
jgi:hypothetical protein